MRKQNYQQPQRKAAPDFKWNAAASDQEQKIKVSFQNYIQQFSLKQSFMESLKNDIFNKERQKYEDTHLFYGKVFPMIEMAAMVLIVVLFVAGMVSGIYLHQQKRENMEEETISEGYNVTLREYISYFEKLQKNQKKEKEENSRFIQNYGIDLESTAILYDFQYGLKLGDHTKLWECSEDRLIIFTTRGAFVYDRKEKKVKCTIDLQTIQCDDYFPLEQDSNKMVSQTRAYVQDEKLYVFNECGGKPYGTCYIYDLTQIDTACVRVLPYKEAKEAGGSDLMKRWKELAGSRECADCFAVSEEAAGWNLADTQENTMDVRRQRISAAISSNDGMLTSMEWTDADKHDFCSLMAHCDNEEGIAAFWFCTRDKRNGDISMEEFQLGFWGAINDYHLSHSVTRYQYTGEDALLQTIVDYEMARGLLGVITPGEQHFERGAGTTGNVVIPLIHIVDIIENGDQKTVYLYLTEEKFRMVGNTFFFAEHASSRQPMVPFKMELAMENDGQSFAEVDPQGKSTLSKGKWKVISCERIGYNEKGEIDQSNPAFQGQTELYRKYSKAEKKIDILRSQLQRQALRQYICDNGLVAGYFCTEDFTRSVNGRINLFEEQELLFTVD